MHTTAAFGALSFGLIGFSIIVLLVVALIALHRENLLGDSATGFGPLVVAVLGLCTFMALMSGVMRVRKLVEPKRISERVQMVLVLKK